jgi:hypothetical protein
MWLELDKGPALMLHFGMTGSVPPTLLDSSVTRLQNNQLTMQAECCPQRLMRRQRNPQWVLSQLPWQRRIRWLVL